MSEHTTGPWRISDDGRTIEPVNDPSRNIGGCVVRRMLPANAHLIAGAPDLLVALQETLTALVDASQGADPALYPEIERARAAIAKAKGDEDA